MSASLSMSEPLRSLAHTRAHACMPTALCRDGTRGVSSACAICKLLLREYAYARGGGVIAVRFCTARTRTHTHTHARARLHAHRAVPGWHARSIIGMRDLQAAAARICVCKGGGGGDCRQIQPRAHSLTQARLHANRRAPWRISGQAAVTGHLRDALERPNRPLSSAYRPAHIGPIAC